MDGHPLGVAGGLPLGVGGAIAADLQNPDVRFGGAPFQLVCRLELLHRRLACSSASLFFSALIFGSSSFLPISSWARPIALSARVISLSSCARAARSCASRFAICCSRSCSSARRSSAFLICSCRSNSTIRSPGLTVLPGADQPGDHERVGVRAGKPGCGNRGGLHRLNSAAQPHGTGEVTARDRDRRRPIPLVGLHVSG